MLLEKIQSSGACEDVRQGSDDGIAVLLASSLPLAMEARWGQSLTSIAHTTNVCIKLHRVNEIRTYPHTDAMTGLSNEDSPATICLRTSKPSYTWADGPQRAVARWGHRPLHTRFGEKPECRVGSAVRTIAGEETKFEFQVH